MAKYATQTMMVIYPLLGGLIRLDVNPNGGFSAGVMLRSFGGDDIFFLFFSILFSLLSPFFPFLFLFLFGWDGLGPGGGGGGGRIWENRKIK